MTNQNRHPLQVAGLMHPNPVLFVYKTYVNESAWFSDCLWHDADIHTHIICRVTTLKFGVYVCLSYMGNFTSKNII